ncbi:MAG: flavodoxin family protein [Candidatus Freyrarchaeum guaymaensis]
MKVIGIVCSPRKGGNTEILVREALDRAKSLGATVELILTGDKVIEPCNGCDTCIRTEVCKIDDDMQEIYRKLVNADGIILGTPVYWINVSAQAKLLIDRTYALLYTGQKLRNKVGGAIVAVRRVGGGQVLGYLYMFFTIHGMLIAGGTIGYGWKKGDVVQGDGMLWKALDEARAVGESVVRLIKRMEGDAD